MGRVIKKVIVAVLMTAICLGGIESTGVTRNVVKAEVLQPIDVVVVTANSVNARVTASTKANSLGKVTKGVCLARYSLDLKTGWSCIDYCGTPAYIMTKYLAIYGTPEANVAMGAAVAPAPATSNSAVAAVATPVDSNVMVWIPTKGGKKYHSNSFCSNMNGPRQVTERDASAQGFTPCKKCH